MHIPKKTLELREKIFGLQKAYLSKKKEESLSEQKANMRDSICKTLGVTTHRYYRACMSLERIDKLVQWRKQYRENQSKTDKYFLLNRKIRGFQTRGPRLRPITHKDILDKFGENPICFFTGSPIDYNDTNSYQLDHIVPVSKGGTSDLSNLQLISPMANKMKNDIDLDIFINACKSIAKRHSGCPF